MTLVRANFDVFGELFSRHGHATLEGGEGGRGGGADLFLRLWFETVQHFFQLVQRSIQGLLAVIVDAHLPKQLVHLHVTARGRSVVLPACVTSERDARASAGPASSRAGTCPVYPAVRTHEA